MLLEILEIYNYEPQLGMALPLILGLVGVAGQVVTGIKAKNAAERARTNANTLKGQLLDLENARQDVFDSSDDIRALGDTLSNPYANLSVATQAAEMQAEQTDIALANTLDAVRAGGFGAGGATALAQAAARSKQGISASIEQQEVNNEKLRAQGEDRLQTQRLSIEEAAINAEGQAWARQEERDLTQLDRKQAEIDQALGQQAQSNSDMMGAFTGAFGSLTSLGMSGMGTGTTNIPEKSGYLVDNFNSKMMLRPGGNINSGNYSRTAILGMLPVGGGQINSGSTTPKLRII